MQILETALTVFASHGFLGTSIKDIAEAAGISQGLMYHYFASKEELLKATIEHHSFLAQLRQILTDNRDLPVNEVLRDIASRFLEMLDKKKKLVSILIKEVDSNPEVQKAWANLCREGATLLQKYLEDHIANGDLRPHNTEVSARSMFGMMFMFHFTREVFKFSPVTREQFIEEALNNTLKGIQWE